MTLFAKDSYVWLPDEEEGFIPAKVMGSFSAGEKGTVMNLNTKSAYTLTAADSKMLLPMDEQSLTPLEDMVQLKQLDEPALLHNLRLRYYADEIYTNIGTILVSVNPFKKLNIYSPEIVDNFIQQGAANNPPHIFGVSDNAYKNLIVNRKSQSCIVSGESGAGKTEATKLFLQYLAEKSTVGDDKGKAGAGDLHERILEANPLMEAFGNAKTVRNNNSSRFGKLIKVDFKSSTGKIVGGNITSYLLEKSRLVHQMSGERNYHIFYQLCKYASTDPEFNEKLKLQDASQYYYSNPTDDPTGIEVDGMDDANEFQGTLNAMDVLDLSEEQQDEVFVALAGILNLGNVEFTANGDACIVSEAAKHPLQRAADLLGVSSDELGKGLIQRKVSDVYKQHTLEEAISARDAFSKALYGYLFDWLIMKINESLAKGASKNADVVSISVLDIFGFESFEINSFEQLCINYCNEKLQSHFNEHIFSLEQKLYAEEGIDLKKIEFADNGPTLAALESKTGVFSLIDEVNKMPKGTDEVFLKKVHDKCDGAILVKPDVKAMRKKANQVVFSVVHYAGEVAYTVTGFLEKNKDRLLEGLSLLGSSSKNVFVKYLFTTAGSAASNKKTLGSQFKLQLADLMKTLGATEPHYVRTIKPNSRKVSDVYTAQMVLDQMRYAGLMEVCRIRKLGYPVRKTFKEFLQRYRALSPNSSGIDHVQLCKDLEKQGLFAEGRYQIGKTQVFMRDDQFNNIEKRREIVLGEKVIVMQRIVRRFLARCRFAKYKQVLEKVKDATKARQVEMIEDALRSAGILPYSGKHIEVVQNAKKVLAALKEELRALELLQKAIDARDLSSLNSAIATAEGLKLSDHPTVRAAMELREVVLQEKACLESLVAAVKADEMGALTTAINKANDLKLNNTNAYGDAVSALKHLQEIEVTVKALDAAIAKASVPEIVAQLTKMAELGKTDHPSVLKGQEVAKEVAKRSKESERKQKELLQKLQQAITSENLAALKQIRPEVLALGLQGDIVSKANDMIDQLTAREEAYAELTAARQAVELVSTSYEGVTSADVAKFSEAIVKALKLGWKEDDEEMSNMKDFEVRMKSQAEAQSFLADAMSSKDEGKLRKALEIIQDLGLETGIAKDIEQEIQIKDNDLMEKEEANREKKKEELKKELKQGNEDDREDEKQELLSKKTTEHQALIAKASDSNKYAFQKYYKIRSDGDYVETIPEESKKAMTELKLKYQPKMIPKSLLTFPAELSKLAVQNYKGILQYTGDLHNPYPNTMARFVITQCLENPAIVDEVYLQLLKHLTENKKVVSEDRGWGLLCMVCESVPPSPEFAPFVLNFLINKKSTKGLIGNYARLCIVQLDGRIRLGPTKLLPDIEVIDKYSMRPPILATIHLCPEDKDPLEVPVTPDEDIDKLLNETLFPLLKIKEENAFLYGLFVIDGRPETDMDLRARLTRFYQKYNPAKIQHIDYFLRTWTDNFEGLFHKLESKYGPEPTEEEVADALRKRGKAEKRNYLQLPITAAKSAAKRLGLAATETKPPPAPQTSWPLPWWVHLGDIYHRLIKQNRIPIFTLKRKLFIADEAMSDELVQQTRHDVVKGDLGINAEDDVHMLSAIHLTLRNKCKVPKDEKEIVSLGLVDTLPVPWLADRQPKSFIEPIKSKFSFLEGADQLTLNTKYYDICRKQPGFGKWFFYLNQPNSPEPLVAAVDIYGVHIMDESRSIVHETYGYRKIKEYGAGPTYFWMKVVEKEPTKKKKKLVNVEDTIFLNTIQAWDLYGLVYDYTYNAKQLKLP